MRRAIVVSLGHTALIIRITRSEALILTHAHTIVICSRHFALIMRTITPKAIILAHPAYSRRELPPDSNHRNNNRANGNNTYACGVQLSPARFLICFLSFVRFVSFDVVFLFGFALLSRSLVFVGLVRSRFFCLVCCLFVSFYFVVATSLYPLV